MEIEQDTLIQGELIYYAHTLSPRFKELLLIPTSDVHYGNPLHSASHFRRHLKLISDTPNAVTIFNGDIIEAVTKQSKGDIYKQSKTPQDQADDILEMVYPIRRKILGWTMGNHEYRIYSETGIDLCKYMAKQLGAAYRPEGILLKITFGSGNEGHPEKPYTYWVYATHGYGGARTKSGKAVKVERTATWVHADAYTMSHDHVVNLAFDVYLMPDARTRKEVVSGRETGFTIGKVVEHRKILIKTNAFLKWGGYAEMGGFPPVDLETPIIKFSGIGKKGVRVTV